MTRGTSAPRSRRAITCWAWRSPPRADCGGPTGRIPSGRRSTTHFTSFDDGAAGISDYLWRLFEVTRAQRFRTGALEGMRWVIARAEGPDCPQVSCSWRWTDDPSWRVAYNGVGMGQAGIVLALDAFADRTGDPTFRAYARAGAAHLRTMTADGARPLPRGSEDDTAETGFLSGSAGAAYMFFERYRHDRDPRRPRHRAPAAGLGERAGGRRPARAGCAGRSRPMTPPARPVSSSVPRASPGSTSTRPVRRATRDTSTSRAGRRSG